MGTTLNKLVFAGQKLNQTREYNINQLRGHGFITTTRFGNEIVGIFFDTGSPNTILYSHGNAENIFISYDWYEHLAERLNVNICAYDYSGYGLSSGIASEKNVYADIDAVFLYLMDIRNIARSNIILFGCSLGSSPAIYLASRLSKLAIPPAAMILQSPLKSVLRIVFDTPRTSSCDMFPNIDHIGDVSCPVFIIHGTMDEVVPFNHGVDLFEQIRSKYRKKCYWVEGAGHNDLEVIAGREYLKSISNFLNEVSISYSNKFV